MVKKPYFITLEGGEGAGKSTQAAFLEAYVAKKGYPVLRTREPGGSPGGELIRKLLVEGNPDRWDEKAEYLLFAAARHDHIEKVLKPALARGQWVICDRFLDSSRAYQGLAGHVGLPIINQIYHLIDGDFDPDLTFILDLPVQEGLLRTQNRLLTPHERRFEQKDFSFHEHLRVAYHDLASAEPGRCVLVNAHQPPQQVSQDLIQALENRLGLSYS